MRGVDEPLESERPTIGRVGGGQMGAVIAPVQAPGNSATGMSSIAVTPSSRRAGEVRNKRASKVPSWREGADVDLGDDEVARARGGSPAGVGPRGTPPGRARASRRAAPFRLPARARVGQQFAVDHVRRSPPPRRREPPPRRRRSPAARAACGRRRDRARARPPAGPRRGSACGRRRSGRRPAAPPTAGPSPETLAGTVPMRHQTIPAPGRRRGRRGSTPAEPAGRSPTQ